MTVLLGNFRDMSGKKGMFISSHAIKITLMCIIKLTEKVIELFVKDSDFTNGTSFS